MKTATFEKLTQFLTIMVNPSFWIRVFPYSKVWDRELNRLMETNDFEIYNPLEDDIGNEDYKSTHDVKIGNHVVWICNYPYAAFSIKYGKKILMPSRFTVLKARRKLDAQLNMPHLVIYTDE